MRIYVVALFAFSPVEDESVPDSSDNGNSNLGADLPFGIRTSVLPALVPAESIEVVIDMCRARAFERWKPEEGWYGHRATILPVTEAFYEAAFKAHDAGVLDMSDEPERSVTL